MLPSLTIFGKVNKQTMKMNATKPDSDSDSDDTLTSPACTDSSGEESDHGEISDSESISLSVVSTTSTVTSKKSTNKKRVSFKPGDSLVLIYEIPNRAMLGLKSDSESSDDDGDESDEEDSTSDSEDDSDDDDGDGDDNENNKNERKMSKSLPKLLSVKQVSRRNNVVCKTEIKRNSRKVAQLIGLSINPTQQSKQKKRTRKFHRVRTNTERSEKDKVPKKDPHPKAIVVDEVNKKKTLTRMSRGLNAITSQSANNKTVRTHRNRNFLEIKATLQTNSRDTCSPTPRVTQYKQDLKPSIATLDSHGAISVCGKQITQKLTHRARLQPTSFRLAKTRLDSAIADKSVASSMTALEREKCTPGIKQAMSARYESLDSLKRLDPDNMNAKNKRNYAWQVANGRISSHQLRTPSILPFWDSLQNTISDNNVIKLPT